MHYANDKDLECGILITTIEAKDGGRWKCNIGVVSNSEVLTASGIANITIATPPTDVFLDTPHNSLNSNFTHGGINQVKCTAKNSRPAPTFHWMVDEDVLQYDVENIFDEEAQIFSQVLKFIPSLSHANKTLSCLVQHPGMDKNVSASTEINISGQSKVVVMGHLGFGELMAIILTAIALLIISALAFFARRKYFQQNQDIEKTSVDEEKGGEGGENKPEENEDVKENDEKTFEEKKGLEIKAKVVQILASLKPNKEKKMAEDVVAATEFEKVELTETEGEKQDKEKPTECAQEPKQSFGNKIASFFAKLKQASAENKKDEEVEEKVEEAKKDDVELDPESTENKVTERRRRGSETPV